MLHTLLTGAFFVHFVQLSGCSAELSQHCGGAGSTLKWWGGREMMAGGARQFVPAAFPHQTTVAGFSFSPT